MKKTLLALTVIAAITGCAQQQTDTIKESTPALMELDRQGLDLIIGKHTDSFISTQPTLATSLGLSKQQAGDFATKLPDYSPSGMQHVQQTMQNAAAALSKVNLNTLSANDKLHTQVNLEIDRYYAGFPQFEAGYIDTWGGHLPYVVSQISGPLMNVPTILQDQQVVKTVQDAQDYLARLQAVAVMADDVYSKVKSDANNGVILPKNLFPKTMTFLNGFVAPQAKSHSLVKAFAGKLKTSEITDQREVKALLTTASNIVDQEIYPAYQRVISLMGSLEAKAPAGDGIWAQPNGAAFYQHAIKYLADSDLTAEQIHNIGLSEVARISKQMNEILTANGRTEGSVGKRMVALAQDPQFLFADSDEGRAELLNFLNQEIETIMVKAPELFATMPKTGVMVKRIPQVIEAGAPGGYYMPPALDGSREGEFAINLRDMTEVPKFSLKTLTYHEAVPGHHFQIALNMEQTDIGLMRQNAPFNAYVEGWALYSELVAMEMGMYKDDEWGNLGRLQAELYRAVRLVVDTGLHHKRWTRQEAIDYFHNTTGTGLSDVTSEVERYMAWPGQALGYKLGMLKFVELRQNARDALGEKFDAKVFHDLILLRGARPMALVESDIEAWVAKFK